jgi:hypothetical protein
VVFWDGSKYPLTAAGLQSAISAAACNGTIPGRVEFPLTGVGQFVTISATVTVPSNCSLNGPGKDRIILHSSVSLKAAIMTVANASKVVLRGFGGRVTPGDCRNDLGRQFQISTVGAGVRTLWFPTFTPLANLPSLH